MRLSKKRNRMLFHSVEKLVFRLMARILNIKSSARLKLTRAKRISDESPIGSSLLNHKVGDEVSVELEAGTKNYKITAIK